MKDKLHKALEPRYGRRIWIISDGKKSYVFIPMEMKVKLRGKKVSAKISELPKFTPKLLAC